MTADQLVPAIVSAIVAVGGLGIMFRFLNKKIDGKTDKSECGAHIESINKEFDSGAKNFDALNKSMSDFGEMLARIDERTLIMAKKNGSKG